MPATSKPQEHISPTNVLWDQKHFKALLGLPRFPLRLIQEEPWQGWIEQRGGLDAIRKYLTTCTLPHDQQELLQTILACPDASTQYYASRLNISPSTYFRLMNDLAQILIPRLNFWKLEQSTAAQQIPTPPTNLSAPLTSLIGMDELTASTSSVLMQPDVRLFTITGPGGVGKTRLAIQVATQLLMNFRDGVYFVPLASVNDSTLLVAEIVRVLGVEGSGHQPLLAILKSYLRERHSLIILDSFEHLIDSAPVVAELLQQAPALKIVVTSREMLHLYGEHRCEIPLLAVPDLEHLPSTEQLEQYPSVRLFIERARAVQPDFMLTDENASAVAEVCCCLDGLPLAIELAAARVKLFPPTQMLLQMKNRLSFLKSGPRDQETRHQALWNTIDWSCTLLNETEKALFRRLSIFAHEWSLEAAQNVCDIPDAEPGLETLVDKSLVQFVGPDVAGFPHYQMLQTIQEYARQQLELSGEAEELQRRHASYYLALLEEAGLFLDTPRLREWASRIKQEHNNLRAVLNWALAKEPEIAIQLVASIWVFWEMLNILSEGRRWAEQALLQTQHLKTPARVKVLQGTGWLALSQNDYIQGQKCFTEALALARELDDRHLIALVLQGMGETLRSKGEYGQAKACFEESLALFRDLGEKAEVAWALDHLGYMAWHQNDAAQARLRLEEALELFQGLGYQWGMCLTLEHLGRALLALGEYRQAQASLERALELLKEYGTRWHMAWTLSALGRVMLAQGEQSRARELFKESLNLHREVENKWGVIISLMDFAALAVVQEDYEDAVRLSSIIYAGISEFAASMPSDTDQLLRDMDKILPIANAHLDKATYSRFWEEGKAMNLDETIPV